MATLEAGTTPWKRPPTGTVTLTKSVEMTYLTHTYLQTGHHEGGMGGGRESAKIRRNTEQMIRNDQLVEKHVQCKTTQQPCKSPKGRPTGHVLLKGEPLTALVRV